MKEVKFGEEWCNCDWENLGVSSLLQSPLFSFSLQPFILLSNFCWCSFPFHHLHSNHHHTILLCRYITLYCTVYNVEAKTLNRQSVRVTMKTYLPSFHFQSFLPKDVIDGSRVSVTQHWGDTCSVYMDLFEVFLFVSFYIILLRNCCLIWSIFVVILFCAYTLASSLTFIRLVHLVEKLLSLSLQVRVSMFVRVIEHTQPPIWRL